MKVKLGDIIGVADANVRKTTGLTDVTELAESMEAMGLIHPIKVRPVRKGKYEVTVGQRRYLAAKQLGWGEIEAIVKETSNGEAMIQSLVENIQRGDLGADEEADAVAELYRIFKKNGKTQEDVGKALGKSREWVRDHLKAKGIIDIFREARPERQHAAIPRDTTKISEIGRIAETVWPGSKKRQADFFDRTKDLDRGTLRKVGVHARSFPEKPPATIVEEALKEPKSIAIEVEFAPSISRRIIKAAEDREMSYEEIVKIAVEEWLKRVGY